MARTKFSLTNRSGFGIVEVLLSISMLVVVALGLSTILNGTMLGSKKLSSKSACQAAATGLIESISSSGNALVIRSWLPATSRSIASADASDPLCNGSDGRGSLCDSYSILSSERDVVDASKLNTSRNIRGSATWAVNLYDAYPSEICRNEGKVFSGRDLRTLEKLLPRPAPIPDWVDGAQLIIQQVDGGTGQPLPCNGQKADARSKGSVHLRVKFQLQYAESVTATSGDTREGSDSRCSAQTDLRFTSDQTPAVTSVGSVKNGAGVEIPSGKCTCQRPWDFGNPEGLPENPCNERKNVKIRMLANEPGAAFFCKWDLPSSDPGDRYCGDIGAISLKDDGDIEKAVLYNKQNTIGELQISGLADETYQLGVASYDVGENRSPASSPVSFIVRTPTGCKDPYTFCSDEPAGTDSCGNPCPPGDPCPPPPPDDPDPSYDPSDPPGDCSGWGIKGWRNCESQRGDDASTECKSAWRFGANCYEIVDVAAPPDDTPPPPACANANQIVSDPGQCDSGCAGAVACIDARPAKDIRRFRYDIFCCYKPTAGCVYGCAASDRARPTCRSAGYKCVPPGAPLVATGFGCYPEPNWGAWFQIHNYKDKECR